MTRNLRVLGLVLLATLAVSAPGASADDFHSEGAETQITGTLEGPFEITVSSGTVKCATGTYSGKMTSSTTTTIAVAPVYSGCTATFGFFAKITMNGCEYLFHAEEETLGSTSLVCPKEKEVTITVEGLLGEDICTIHIHPETGHVTAKKTNIGMGTTREIVKHTETFGMTYTETKGTAKEPCKTTKTTHDLEGKATWKDTGSLVVGGQVTHIGIEVQEAK